MITRGKPRGGVVRSILDITVGRLLKWIVVLALIGVVLAVIGFALFVYVPAKAIPSLEKIDGYVYLDQGWGTTAESSDRQTYYYTAQGTSLPQGELIAPLRYDWFVNLEMPLDQGRFADPDHMRRYRFMVDPKPTPANPDQLPVGFTRHFDAARGEYVLDLTCSACHTGELHARKDGKNVAIRIDGGQAMHAFTSMQRGAFGPTLVASMIATWSDPWKFDRFAKKVIGARYPQGKSQLHSDLWETIKAFATQGQNSPFRHLYAVQEGFGRTDALGRIADTVFGDHLSAANYQKADAPVSYPYLWNIWKFDWVQYNGSVSQPLARNIGESLGVGAVIRMTDTYGNPVPQAERYVTSVDIPNLDRIEHTLQKLKPPRWPEDVLGSVDQALASRGGKLFEQHCQGCHGPHVATKARQVFASPTKTSPDEEWMIEVIPAEHIGTDPNEANGFLSRRYDLTRAGITREEISRVLRPEFIRNLAREVRWRLSEVIDGRGAKNQDVGKLPDLLATYPDPNADPTPSLSHESFAAIASELGGTAAETSQPAFECALDCQTKTLLFDVVNGEKNIDKQIAALDVSKLTEGEGLNVLGLIIKAKYFADNHTSYQQQQCVEGFGILDLPQQIAGYKPRPLEGVWATPPFLHNGSVPNIYEMLIPPEQRTKRFFVGRRDYDAKKLGYVDQPLDGSEADGFWLDTSKDGNHNTGHAFTATPEQAADWKTHPLPSGVIGPLLSDDERLAIVEYLKVHRDLPATPVDFTPAVCTP